jgi:uncharacterized protein (TIGR02453 family)
MPFAGFGPRALPFFKALAFHQSKEWFEDNRAIYESEVKAPLGDLVEDLTASFAGAGIPLKGDRKTSIFRLNRDVRFSKDKRPYKTNAGALLTRTGAKQDFSGAFYIHISPEGSFAAAGFYQPEPGVLGRMRRAIVRSPKAYARAIADLERGGMSISYEDKLTRLPRGFEEVADPVIVEALKRRSHIGSRPIPDEGLADTGLVEELTRCAKSALRLLEWGWSAIAEAR